MSTHKAKNTDSFSPPLEGMGEASNPLLKSFSGIYQTAPFNSIKIEHYLPAFDVAIEETKAEVQQIIDNPAKPDFVNTIVALDLAGEKLERIKGIFFNLNSAETSDEMQEIAQEIAPKLSDLGNDISLNEQLFARIKDVHDQKDFLVLNVEESTLLEKTYRRFVRSGANLNETDKAKYREITKELSTLGLQYQQNVLAETNAYELLITDEKDLSGLPASVIELAAQTAQAKDKQGWLFNLQYPSYFPFLKYADNRSLREQIFSCFEFKGQSRKRKRQQGKHQTVGSTAVRKSKFTRVQNTCSI